MEYGEFMSDGGTLFATVCDDEGHSYMQNIHPYSEAAHSALEDLDRREVRKARRAMGRRCIAIDVRVRALRSGGPYYDIEPCYGVVGWRAAREAIRYLRSEGVKTRDIIVSDMRGDWK
jgi:hypothetical protein